MVSRMPNGSVDGVEEFIDSHFWFCSIQTWIAGVRVCQEGPRDHHTDTRHESSDSPRQAMGLSSQRLLQQRRWNCNASASFCRDGRAVKRQYTVSQMERVWPEHFGYVGEQRVDR